MHARHRIDLFAFRVRGRDSQPKAIVPSEIGAAFKTPDFHFAEVDPLEDCRIAKISELDLIDEVLCAP